MAWDVRLLEMEGEEIDKVMLHPEQLRNLQTVASLLGSLDSGRTLDDLNDLQAHLFRYSYRAQLFAQSIGRALSRARSDKAPDLSGNISQEDLDFVEPAWEPVCSPDSGKPEDWELERRVAERVIRQLRSVGDALAWRVYGHDRRLIIAVSRNDPPGPFVGKDGLNAELGVVQDIRKRGGFGLLHDLTSVVRTLDVTDVDAAGFRTLKEVKARDTASARTKAAKQIRKAQELLDAVDGHQPLPDEEGVTLFRATTQMRTLTRQLTPLLRRIEEEGHGSARLADRVVGGVYIPALANLKQPHPQTWQTYTARRDQLLDLHQGSQAGLHRLRTSTGDTAARDSALVPWGLYPWDVRHRAALICDYMVLEIFMSLDQIGEHFRHRGYGADIQLPAENSELTSTANALTIHGRNSRMAIHGGALQQLMLEFIDTRRFVDAALDTLQHTDPGLQRSVLVYSNERGCWR